MNLVFHQSYENYGFSMLKVSPFKISLSQIYALQLCIQTFAFISYLCDNLFHISGPSFHATGTAEVPAVGKAGTAGRRGQGDAATHQDALGAAAAIHAVVSGQ